MRPAPAHAFFACLALGCYGSRADVDDDDDDSADPTSPATATCGDGKPEADEVCLAQTRLPAPFAPHQLARGDFDADGAPDWFAADDATREFQLLAETGGKFVQLDDFTLPVAYSLDRAVAGDFDRDGRTDLFGLMHDADTQTGVLLVNRGSFSFDFDTQVFLDPGAPIIGEDPPNIDLELALGDFDGDGIDELFVLPQPQKALVLAYAADAALVYTIVRELDLTPLGVSDHRDADRAIPTVADFDRDGRDDVLLSDEQGKVWLLHADPGYDLVARQPIGQDVLLPSTFTVLVDDLDADGELDLVGLTHTANTSTVVLAHGDGGGNFTRLEQFPTLSEPAFSSVYPRAVLLDLDTSGHPALVYATVETRSLVVHPQLGLKLGADPVEFPLEATPSGVFLDTAADGKPTLLVPVTDELDKSFIDRWRLDP